MKLGNRLQPGSQTKEKFVAEVQRRRTMGERYHPPTIRSNDPPYLHMRRGQSPTSPRRSAPQASGLQAVLCPQLEASTVLVKLPYPIQDRLPAHLQLAINSVSSSEIWRKCCGEVVDGGAEPPSARTATPRAAMASSFCGSKVNTGSGRLRAVYRSVKAAASSGLSKSRSICL